MSTVKRGLPAQPHLDVPKQQARDLLRQCKTKLIEALDRIRRRHPRFPAASDEAIAARLKLSDAQLIIAREYGFSSWTELKERISGNTATLLIEKAIRAGDAVSVGDVQPQSRFQQDPRLIHRGFSYREIYPPELGCADDLRYGLGRFESPIC